MADLGAWRLRIDEVQRAIGVGVVEIGVRRQRLMLDGEAGRGGLEGAGGAERMARDALDRAHRNAGDLLAEGLAQYQRLLAVEGGQRVGVGADVVDVRWCELALRQRPPQRHGTSLTGWIDAVDS